MPSSDGSSGGRVEKEGAGADPKDAALVDIDEALSSFAPKPPNENPDDSVADAFPVEAVELTEPKAMDPNVVDAFPVDCVVCPDTFSSVADTVACPSPAVLTDELSS